MLITCLFSLVFITHPIIVSLYIKAKREKCTALLEQPLTGKTINQKFFAAGRDNSGIHTAIFYSVPTIVLLVTFVFLLYTTTPLANVGVILMTVMLSSLTISTISVLIEIQFSELDKLYRKYTAKVEVFSSDAEKALSDTESTTESAETDQNQPDGETLYEWVNRAYTGDTNPSQYVYLASSILADTQSNKIDPNEIKYSGEES